MPVSKKFWATLNSSWPKGLAVPTDKEAIHGVKRLYRHAMGRPCPYKIQVVHHKARHTWVRRGVLIVSPEYRHPLRGWPAIVHDLSHWFHYRKHPGATPHDSRQARLERRLQSYVLRKGLAKAGKL